MKLMKIMFLLLTLSFMGCINIHETIYVKKNGSGTIKLRMLFSSSMKETANNIGNMFNDLNDDDTSTSENEEDFFNQEEIKQKENEFGEGVTYVSSKPIKTADMEGVEITYKFDDINKLNDRAFMLSSDDSDDEDRENIKPKRLFYFKKGYPSQLKIKWEPKETSSSKEIDNENNMAGMPQGMGNFMSQMFKGFKIKYDLEFEGRIVKTNANFRDKNKITLLSLDFENLVKNSEDMSKLNRLKGSNKDEMIRIMKKIKGAQIDTNKEIIVKFK